MASASQGSHTSPVSKRIGGSTQDVSVDKAMTFDSDTRKDAETQVIKAAQSDEASKQFVQENTEIVGNEDANLPFEKKKTLLWSTLESMEVFRKLPQKPHFQPLEQFNESFRDGQAIGCMVDICSVVERSSRLQFLNEPKSSTNEVLENLFKLEENGFNVDVVREHIAMREKLEKLQEQFEEVKSEICKRVTERAKFEKRFEAMKEAMDHQISSLKLKRIVLEEDMADVEREFQSSVASLGITGVNLDIGSRESNRRKVGLKACSNIKWNNQVLSTEKTSQADSSPILEKIGDNLVSEKYETNDRREFVSGAKNMAIHNDLDAKKNPVGQLSSSGAHGSVTRNIEELLSQRKKLSEGSRSISLMGKHPKKDVLKSDPTIPLIIDLEDENDFPERGTILQFVQAEEIFLKSDPTTPEIIHLEDDRRESDPTIPERLAIVQSVKAEETAITHSVSSKDKSRTIKSPKAEDKCMPVHFASSVEKSSTPIPIIYLEDEDQDTRQIEQFQVLTNVTDKLDSLGSGGLLDIKSGEEVHKKKGGRPRKLLGGCVLSGNNGVVEESEKPVYSGSDGQLQIKTGEEFQKRKVGRHRKIQKRDGQLQMKSGQEVQKSDGQLQMKTADKKVQKRKRGIPRKLDGFVVASTFPRKRKKKTVPSGTEYSLPRSLQRTKKEKDVQEELVGSWIKVWWPDDQQYYEGMVESYDPAKKKHKVAYLDGDIENLILKKERWLRVDEKSDSQQDQVVSSASAMPAAESEVESKSSKDQEHENGV